MGSKYKNAVNHKCKQTNKKRSNNKAQNLKKKKKLKYKTKQNRISSSGDLKQQVSYLCKDLKGTSPTQAIIRNKKRREEMVMEKDIGTICKNMKELLGGPKEEHESVAIVENLAKNIKDLIIEAPDPHEMGFRFTKQQQQAFHASVKKTVKKCRRSDRRKKMRALHWD